MVGRDPDADLFRDDDGDHIESSASPSQRNPYASATRWRHQESSAFAKHARAQQPQARDADSRGRVGDLADFLNSSRISPPAGESSSRPTTPRFKPVMAGAAEARQNVHGDEPETDTDIVPHGPPPDGKDIAVGPLINYRRMEGTTWVGSVLVVTRGGGKTQSFVPTLHLRRADAKDEGSESEGVCLYSDPRNTFWRFNLSVPMGPVQERWEYELPGLRFTSKTKPRVNSFWVPAVTESMRIMFFSCNGFSVGTDEEAYCGAVLWKDVMRRHEDAPFHVM